MFLTSDIERETDAWYKLLCDNIPCVYLITNAQGNVLFTSNYGAQYLGYSQKELINKPIFNLFHWVHAQRLESALKAVWEESREWEGDWEFLLREKSLNTPRWVKIFAKKVQDIIILVCENSSRYKQLEKVLGESETRLQDLIDAIPVMVWASDAEGLMQNCNCNWLDYTGRTREQEIGNGWLTNLHSDDKSCFLENYARHLSNEEMFEIKYRLRLADGEWHWMLHTSVPFISNGQFAGYIVTCIATENIKNKLTALNNQYLPTLNLETSRETLYKIYLKEQLQEKIGNIKITGHHLAQTLGKKISREKIARYLQILKVECDQSNEILDKIF